VGIQLSHLARWAFMSGMDLGLLIGACVAAAAAVLALAVLPSRPSAPAATQPDPPGTSRES
jgi:anaerobic C4-dicarboxylate transporter